MNGYRKTMLEEGGNLGWCKPFFSRDGRVAFALNDGELASLAIDGEDCRRAEYASGLKKTAEILEADCETSGTRQMLEEIVQSIGIREGACRDCPWFDKCEAMDEE